MSIDLWILDTGHAGDLRQMQAVADAMPDARVRIIRLRPSGRALPRWPLFLGPSLRGLDATTRAQFRPPWPDVVFCAGRGAQAAALWLRAQSAGQTRAVVFLRPQLPPERFDLVISMPCFNPPPGGRTLLLDTPLHGLAEQQLREAAREFAPQLAHLPRPFTAVLVGGASPPHDFSAADAELLLQRLRALHERQGGSLLITTSPRTPPAAVQLLQRLARDVPSHLHLWGSDAPNPYLAYLGLADTIVVTSDSLSMMTEAASTAARTLIFPLPLSRRSVVRLRHWLGRRAAASRGPLGAAMRALNRLGFLQPYQDKLALARFLVRGGYACWLDGDGAPCEGRRSLLPQVQAQCRRAAAAVAALPAR